MKPSTGVVEVDGSPRGRGYRWLCRARGVWRRGGSGEASVAAGGRAAAPGRVQVDDAPAMDTVGASVVTPLLRRMSLAGSRHIRTPASAKLPPTRAIPVNPY